MKCFTKKWYLFEDYSDRAVKKYFDYKMKYLPKWYHEFSIHDDQIESITIFDNSIVLDIISDDSIRTEYQLIFYNPLILENCKIEKAWCIADELYTDKNICEYHLMVMDYNDNDILNYFTIKCDNIELLINNKSFKVFNNTEFGSIWDSN